MILSYYEYKTVKSSKSKAGGQYARNDAREYVEKDAIEENVEANDDKEEYESVSLSNSG